MTTDTALAPLRTTIGNLNLTIERKHRFEKDYVLWRVVLCKELEFVGHVATDVPDDQFVRLVKTHVVEKANDIAGPINELVRAGRASEEE